MTRIKFSIAWITCLFALNGITGQDSDEEIKSSIINQSFNAPPLQIDEQGFFEVPTDHDEWNSHAFFNSVTTDMIEVCIEKGMKRPCGTPSFERRSTSRLGACSILKYSNCF